MNPKYLKHSFFLNHILTENTDYKVFNTKNELSNLSQLTLLQLNPLITFFNSLGAKEGRIYLIENKRAYFEFTSELRNNNKVICAVFEKSLIDSSERFIIKTETSCHIVSATEFFITLRAISIYAAFSSNGVSNHHGDSENNLNGDSEPTKINSNTKGDA